MPDQGQGLFKNRVTSDLLQTIGKKEVKLFSKFIVFKGTKGSIDFWKVLSAFHPNYEVKDIDVFKKLHPSKPYSDGLLRVRSSELNNLIKEFIVYQEFQNNPQQYANTTARALFHRGANKWYLKQKKQNDKLLSEEKDLTANTYFHLHEKEIIDYQFVTISNPRQITESLQQASFYNDDSYLVQKLRYLILLRNRERIVKDNHKDETEERFLSYLAHFHIDNKPIIKVYYLLLIVFKDLTSSSKFQQFKQYFLDNRTLFETNEARQIFTFGTNICFWNIQLGHLDFLAHRFELNKIMVEENYLTVLGHFSSNHFSSIVVSAIEAKELEWGTYFLENTLPKTKANNRNSLEALHRAALLFAKGEYEKQSRYMFQIEQLEEYGSKDPYDAILYRTLKLKTAYKMLGPAPKLRVLESFQGTISSYQAFINRKNSIPLTVKTSRLNFAKAVRLIFLKHHGKKKLSVDLKEEILSLQPITEFPWLLSEI